MAHHCNVGEVLRELEIRTAHALAEAERAREYLRAVPDCRARRQIEDGIVSNTTVAAELEDLQTLITGRPDSPDHTAESPARPKCRPQTRESGEGGR